MHSPPRRTAISKARIESLSDLIFGLALSIGSLVLIANTPSSGTAILQSIGEFALGFLILISVWRSYTEVMTHVEVETTSAVDLNIAMMLLVALEPFLFNLLWKYPNNPGLAEASQQLYSLDLAGLMFILSALLELVIFQLHRKGRTQATAVLAESRVRLLVVAGIFLISALHAFSAPLSGGLDYRELAWGIAVVINFSSRERTRQALHEAHLEPPPPGPMPPTLP